MLSIHGKTALWKTNDFASQYVPVAIRGKCGPKEDASGDIMQMADARGSPASDTINVTGVCQPAVSRSDVIFTECRPVELAPG